MSAQRYPLTWPIGWRRTEPAHRQRARFGRLSQFGSNFGKQALSVADALERLMGELGRLGATDHILSTNVPVRLDGLPLSQRVSPPKDPGAALYFRLKGQARCLACDKWDRVPDNITAIAFHIRALRAVDRYGVGTLDQAFAGYAALPSGVPNWWDVLEIDGTPGRIITLDEVEKAYRRLAQLEHPDVGGSHERMARLNAAREAAREALR